MRRRIAGEESAPSANARAFKPYERSPTPVEEFEDYNGEAWPVMGIVGEEVNPMGESYYEIRWGEWQRKDGSNTTWSRAELYDDAVQQFGEAWREKMKAQGRRLAAESLSVRLDPFNYSPAHDKLTAEKAEAVAEKRTELLRRYNNTMPIHVDWDADIIRLGPRAREPATGGDASNRNADEGMRRTPNTSLQDEHARPPSARRRAPSSRIPVTVAGSSRGASSSRQASSGVVRHATPSLMRKSRRVLEEEWSAAAKSAGAYRVRLVNEVDEEEIPELPEGFKWLEAEYTNMPKDVNVLQYCDDLCSCGMRSKFPNDQEASDAYTNEGLLVETLVDMKGAFLVCECNDRCSCGEDCINRATQTPRDVPIEIFKTDNNRGWGARSKRLIRKGKILGIYTGKLQFSDAPDLDDTDGADSELDSDGDVAMRVWPKTDKRKASESYCFNLDFDGADYLSVNAYRYGNWTRFINHSCTPNLRVFTVHRSEFVGQEELTYVTMVATEDIAPRTEFTVDYRPGAGNKRNSTKGKVKGKGKATAPQVGERCQCGSAECRGFIWD